LAKVRGIKASLLKQARVARLPSKQGPCEVCDSKGEIHFMVAAPLPRYLYLCNAHYMKIRAKLEKALKYILQEQGLL
jgi:hypothetical protein